MTCDSAAVSRRASGLAGALPFPGSRRTQYPVDVGLGAYAAALSKACPYLQPSVRAGQTWWTLHRMQADSTFGEVEAALFAAGMWAAEQVRDQVAAGRRLACEVIAVDWRDSSARQRTVLGWPHWALKHLYTPLGVLAGKFPPGTPSRTRDGRAVAAPPVLVLALRAAIPPRDPRLLAGTPALARTIATADDDGRPALAAVPGIDPDTDPVASWPVVRSWAAALPHYQREDAI